MKAQNVEGGFSKEMALDSPSCLLLLVYFLLLSELQTNAHSRLLLFALSASGSRHCPSPPVSFCLIEAGAQFLGKLH